MDITSIAYLFIVVSFVRGSDGPIIHVRLSENYRIIIDKSNVDLKKSLLAKTALVDNIAELLENKNVFAVLAFLGLVVGDRYADSFLTKENMCIYLQVGENEDDILNSSSLNQYHLHVFRQRISKYSDILQAFQADSTHYSVHFSKTSPGIGGSAITKHSFVDELLALLGVLHGKIVNKIGRGQNVIDTLHNYGSTEANAQENMVRNKKYVRLLEIYLRFTDAFMTYVSLSTMLQCKFSFPKEIGLLVGFRFLQVHELGPAKIFKDVFVKKLRDFETNGTKDIKAVEISVTMKLTFLLKQSDDTGSTSIIIPIIFSHYDAIHLTMTDTSVTFSRMVLLRGLMKMCNITRITSSVFFPTTRRFVSFITETSLDCEKVLILDLKGCILEEADIQALRLFVNLKLLVLPASLQSDDVLANIFASGSRLRTSLVELEYNQKLTANTFKILKECTHLEYYGLIPERTFNASDSDIQLYKKQLTVLSLTNACFSRLHRKLTPYFFFHEFFYLRQIIIRAVPPRVGINPFRLPSMPKIIIQFCGIAIGTSEVLRLVSSAATRYLIFEKVKFLADDIDQDMDKYSIKLAEMSILDCEMTDKKIIGLFKRITISKKLTIAKCGIDTELLAEIIENNRSKKLESLILYENRLSGSHQFNIERLTKLTDILIFNRKNKPNSDNNAVQLCNFHVIPCKSKRKPPCVSLESFCTVINLSWHQNLEKLEINMTEDNYDLLIKHFAGMFQLKMLILHVLLKSIDLVSILESKTKIGHLQIYGNGTCKMISPKIPKEPVSKCLNILLAHTIIDQDGVFQYINRLASIEVLDIDTSTFDLQCLKKVDAFRSCKTEHLLVCVAYSNELVEFLVESSKFLNRRSQFSVSSE